MNTPFVKLTKSLHQKRSYICNEICISVSHYSEHPFYDLGQKVEFVC